MKVGFVCTNYNNSNYTISAVESLYNNAERVNVKVVVVDNDSRESEKKKLRDLEKRYSDIVVIYNQNNSGYFKGLNIGINFLREVDYKYIIIGNNDLVFPNNFIDLLEAKISLFEIFPVVSPNIITLDGVHQNPHVIKKTSKLREFIWDIYYLNYFLAKLIGCIANLTRSFTARRDERFHEIPQRIYQGYGACYILGPQFFNNFSELWAPTFLMGEELFLSKQISSKNLDIFYEPSIIVEHHDHASTGEVPSKKFWEISRDSHKVCKKEGYNK